MKVLLIEDDTQTAEYIKDGLSEAGHVVDHAANGPDGFVMALDGTHDVMIVDRMLPGLDGVSLVKSLRSAKTATPILFLSALGGVDDRIDGLEAGGDDYLIKPFSFAELSARLAALARRPAMKSEETVLEVADLKMDLLRRTVTRGGETIPLQPREFILLEYLMRHSDRVLTRTMLLENVWDFHFDPRTNVVETHISRLRNKIDKPFDRELIHTVRGAGYSLHA